MGKELSIIVTSYKNPSVLRLCLESLKKNIIDIDYEILVLDSATEEDTEMMMREDFPEISFHPFEQNLGFSRLVNQGIKKSTGKYFLVLNADIIIEKKSVDLLLSYLKNNPKVGIIGPRLYNFDGNIQASCFRFYTPLTILYRRTFLGRFSFAEKKINDFLYKNIKMDKPTDVDWIMGSAMMTSRVVVEKIGFMEEDFGFMYFEDVDWCRRFWENGYGVVYLPTVKMFHYHGKGSAGNNAVRAILFNKLTREHVKSAVKYFRKYLGKPNPHKI
jgi:N-acetylglucosaminyl-diphospho-decaprenol L-rhamnosyltransferase